MFAYVIVDIEVKDAQRYAEYSKLAPAIVEMYGGKYLARGGRIETLEGAWSPKRVVILQFDSVAHAKKWWDSPEYRAPKQTRQETTNSKMIVVEGLIEPI